MIQSKYSIKWQERRLTGIVLLGGRCVDCGCTDDRVLQFDHIDDVSGSIPKLVGKAFLDELRKCELVCANCHLIRTRQRRQHQHQNTKRSAEYYDRFGQYYKNKRRPTAVGQRLESATPGFVCRRGHVEPPTYRDGRCALCARAWRSSVDKTGSAAYIKKKAWIQQYRQTNRLRAIEYLGGKCTDCGKNDERVLDFDHLIVGPLISKCMDLSWDRLVIELQKCELVCANCHWIRTRQRVL